jgi:hypothetical protein
VVSEVTPIVCLTVDVEDWYEGMEVLGHPIPRPGDARSGLEALLEELDGLDVAVTLFTIGNYAATVRNELAALAAGGHEIASHGPDHGRLPNEAKSLGEWLRRGREVLEDLVQRPIRGFRSPRFDIPPAVGLSRFRNLLIEAGFDYVSDTSCLGPTSPISELPVLHRGHRLPIGGGSYQRFLPSALVRSSIEHATGPAVCYYHSYDFGATLPALRSTRSPAVAKQLLGRGRIKAKFTEILTTYGSEACQHVASAV